MSLSARLLMTLTALALLVSTGEAHAAPGDCSVTAQTHQNVNQLKPFKVNAQALGTLSAESVISAAIAAAAAWNEQANAGTFRFDGLTSSDSLPSDKQVCDNSGETHSIIVVRPDAAQNTGDDKANATARCGGEKFIVQIFAKRPNGDTIQWGDNANEPTKFDVHGTLVHELGHTMNIGHPNPADTAGTMSPSVPASDSAAWRWLYQYDLKCAREIAGPRTTKARKINFTSGSLGTAVDVSATTVVKARAGYTEDCCGNGYFSAGIHRGSAVSFDDNIDGTYTDIDGVGSTSAMGYTTTAWREMPEIDRVMYSHFSDYPDEYDADSEHTARMAWSNIKFTLSGLRNLSHCAAWGGFLTCSGATRVRTAEPVVFGWLSGVSRTVAAWANLDRNADLAASGEVWLSAGVTADEYLAVPYQTGLRTLVGPGLACYDNFSGSFDCLLAFVPMGQSTPTIFVRRYSVAASGNGYAFTPETVGGIIKSHSTGALSANAVSLFYSTATSKFYLAYRAANTGQALNVISSSTGTSWSIEGSNLDSPVTGPSAASVWRGANNRLVYVK